ncbi:MULTISPECIES: symmetrical bis(5'-nucleosyl)-tetraphosphatase [Oligella]|uniref:symmetrical bis(5'-nucleosyl)-tetraphosphatase n=1 Tax=Oligella TaxID=90243 RepID=UPI000AB21B94|nr:MULTISPECIES: symmetrical bis(5'-nucleosyl)-tetraphosphatase [Oligella]SUA57318.1 Bis(5'-nucleosyl)-tetraphosphatase, symmetrical [Oligella urethralis]
MPKKATKKSTAQSAIETSTTANSLLDLNPASAMPNIWAIGDVQGCYQQLESLLNHPEIRNDPNCKLWFAGDIINRGKDSLKTLKCIMDLGDRAITILGNHDIHCLAVAAGFRREHHSDTIGEILKSKNRNDYIEWLRTRPLAHYAYGHLMVHAGVMKPWTTAKALELAEEVSTKVLRSDKWQQKLAQVFGNEPNQWDDSLKGSKRQRVVINAFTRMRMCFLDGAMDFSYKGAPQLYPLHHGVKVLPWFELDQRQTTDTTIIFGHWSTLGLLIRPHLLALDTGCVWGGRLTAIRLNDRKVIQIPYTEGTVDKLGSKIWSIKS